MIYVITGPVPLSAPANLVRMIAATIAERFAFATMERSIPPVSIQTMMPTASSPNSGICMVIDWKFLRVKKMLGSRMLIKIKAKTVKISRLKTFLFLYIKRTSNPSYSNSRQSKYKNLFY
jgi:hypothetical protein